MRSLRTLLLGTALAAGTSLSAMAVPLTGSFDIVGQFQAENTAGANVPFGSATAIDFCNNASGACGPTPGAAGSGTGAFMVTQATAGNNLGLSTTGGEVGSIKDVIFDPFTGPVTNFYTVGDLSFDLTDLDFQKFTIQSPNSSVSFIALGGAGILKRAGFDDTAGTFSFTGQTDGVATVGTFSFSGASAAIGVPEPASLALFGAGLLGLGLVRRRKANAAA